MKKTRLKRLKNGIFHVSDIHIDTHTDTLSPAKMERVATNLLFGASSFEDALGGTLLVAGDLGHYPKQNAVFLKACESFFDKILYVFGNHEMYLLPGRMRGRYRDSFEKLEDIRLEVASRCAKTEILEGERAKANGLEIFGVPMWYDFSYLTQRGYGKEYAMLLWKNVMNDSRTIVGRGGRPFDPLEYFDEQFAKLSGEGFSSDIILTHVPPVHMGNEIYGESEVAAFYSFDGEDFLKSCEAFAWVCGHNHEPKRNDFEVYGTLITANPLGYGF